MLQLPSLFIGVGTQIKITLHLFLISSIVELQITVQLTKANIQTNIQTYIDLINRTHPLLLLNFKKYFKRCNIKLFK